MPPTAQALMHAVEQGEQTIARLLRQPPTNRKKPDVLAFWGSGVRNNGGNNFTSALTPDEAASELLREEALRSRSTSASAKPKRSKPKKAPANPQGPTLAQPQRQQPLLAPACTSEAAPSTAPAEEQGMPAREAEPSVTTVATASRNAEETASAAESSQKDAFSPASAAGPSRAGAALVEHSAVPSDLLCPITYELMLDPVFTVDGSTYERRAIETWLAKSMTSPITNAPLSASTLVPNRMAKSLILTFVEQHPHHRECKDFLAARGKGAFHLS